MSEFEKRVEQGYLRKSEKGDLVLYGYTDACTFDRAWDEYTRIARGLILNKNTGEVVAKPFPKFFNLGEMEETFLNNLPNLSYKVSEKLDGSLGIIFNHNDEWHVSTRGSFYSDQAKEAKSILEQYDLDGLAKNITLLVEIIYPENKIIVNYANKRQLVLLGAFNREDGYELNDINLETISHYSGMRVAPRYEYTIDQMLAMQDTMPKDEEGFVIRYENGLRVKIKGKEYLRIAKLMSDLSPIALWETMKNGKVDTFYLQQLPEELRADYEPYVVELEKQFSQVMLEVELDASKLPINSYEKVAVPTQDTRKNVGLFLKANKLKHESAMFPFILGNIDSLNKYVMKQIRPDGNNMKEME